MKVKITSHLKPLLHHAGIAKQYSIQHEEKHAGTYNDPLMEDQHEVTKGLIHKYPNRALIKVNYLCAAHCRFCTRIRQIGNPAGTLSEADIKNIIRYLKDHPEIEDVILSGGDPLITPQRTQDLLEKIKHIKSVKVLRIGTRLPLQSPKSIFTKAMQPLFGLIREIKKDRPFYLLLHVEHPNELVKTALSSIRHLQQKTNAIFLSQSVLLKGINTDLQTLILLFKTLYFNGVTPYYLYHCDKVTGLEHFQEDLNKEIELMRQLRAELSGIACPLFVVDIENGYGKHPVDLGLLGDFR